MSLKVVLPQPGKKEKSPLTLSDRLTRFSFKLFAWPATRISRSVPLLRDNILRSNMRVTPEGWIAVTLFATVVTGILASIGIYVGFVMFRIPYFFALLAVVPLMFTIMINAPRFSASNRASGIDIELPFVLGYLSVLAGGGVSPMAAFRRISQLKLFPSSAKEAKRILVEVEVFGHDPITAIERVARWTPSKRFSEFLFGYTAVLKGGGDFITYMQTKLKDTIENKASSVKRSADTTGTMAEAYLTITVILGMTLYTLYMIQTLLSNNLSGLTNLYLFAFVIVPLISAAFLWVIDAAQPKWPYVDYTPHKRLMFTVPAAIVFFFASSLLGLHIYLRTAISLVIAASLPAAAAFSASREKHGLERALPEFIRDVAEGRKTGLSPEIAIERLTDRHYGALTKHVKKMGAQLSWGVSLSKVVSTFASSVHSWITRAIGTLLIEVVDVGGGTIRSFSEMAEFTRNINDMESDRRAALRPYVYITYVAGVMVIITTFIMVYLLGAPSLSGFSSASSLAINPATIDLLLTTAVFDSYVIGIVAGKMGESGVADGYKHAIALVIVGLIAIYVARLFIKIPV